MPQPGEVKNFGMATIRNCLFGMKLRSKYFRKEYILSKNYRAELVGLFGNPVDENPTGPMMEAGFAAQGLNYRYITMKVEKENLKDAIAGIRAIGMRGLNLTIPHKIAVIPFLDELSPAAKIIGAVNSIRVQDGQLIGENTDGKGFVTSLMETGVELNGRIITVLGSGGAARAVAVECAISGAETVNIVARNEESGKELADLISEKTEAQGVYFTWKGSVPIPEGTEVLVNCTNVGLYPDENKPDITYEDIRKNMTVCDVVFNPPETKFLKEAKARGAATVNGLGMLSLIHIYIILLAPFAPHVSEELWEQFGHTDSVFHATWPEYDEEAMKDDEIEIPVQINGKTDVYKRQALQMLRGLRRDRPAFVRVRLLEL